MFDHINFNIKGIAQKNALYEVGADQVEMEVSLFLNGELIELDEDTGTPREAAEAMGGDHNEVNRIVKAINAMTEPGSLLFGHWRVVWSGDYTYCEGGDEYDHIGHYW